MKERGSITTMEAFSMYGITRLSGRIYELRKEHRIIGEKEVSESGRAYSRYRLGGDAE